MSENVAETRGRSRDHGQIGSGRKGETGREARGTEAGDQLTLSPRSTQLLHLWEQQGCLPGGRVRTGNRPCKTPA